MSTVYHGALNYAELAKLDITPDEVIDFSSNCNPWGPPPAVISALRGMLPAALARYPDRESLALREKLADLHEIERSQITVGNGSAELIWAVARAFLKEHDHVVILGPTFGEYAAASAACGAQVSTIDVYRSESSYLEVEGPTNAKLVWLCNPNNPTGHLWTTNQLAQVRDHYRDAILIIDEAYLPFVRNPQATPPDEHTIILRSLTKDFGMAGIRLGYLLAIAQYIAQTQALLPPWSVSATAQEAGLAALNALTWREETLVDVWKASLTLRNALHEQGWRLDNQQDQQDQPAVPFFLLHAGNGAALRAHLLQKGLIVRDCASFGLPEWVRIAPQRPEENAKLIVAMGELGGISYFQ